jgi:hypothetical protein
MALIVINRYEDTPTKWDNMVIKMKWSEWNISSNSDGDVEIECSTEEDYNHLFLNQDELKQFIEFLKEKVIH